MLFRVVIFVVISIFWSCSFKATTKNPLKSEWIAFQRNGIVLNYQSNDTQFSADTRAKLIETFFIVYPQLIEHFNPQASKTIYFLMDTSFNQYPAARWGDTIRYSSAWFTKNPKDIDVVTHEVMHIAQSYPSYDPWWLVEGIADYVRYKYGVANVAGGWHLPEVTSSQKYDNGYRVTARFLVWCENKKPGSVKAFDHALRTNRYNSNLWKTIFGKTVDELWKEYLDDAAI